MKKAARPTRPGGATLPQLRRRLYVILEQAPPDDFVSVVVNRLLILLIIVNLFAVVMESVPEVVSDHVVAFRVLELVSLVVFSVEYALRIWIAAEHTPYRLNKRRRARLGYITSLQGLVDLAAVVPFWVGLFLITDLRVLLVFRIVRFLKLVRYSPAMRSLLDAVYAERRALFGCLVIFFGMTLVAATVMHVVERAAQPERFGTIPEAMWWAVVTLGTIGYGDVVPVTTLGRLVGSLTIFAALIVIALPVGIVATAFADEVHRRDFVVTWGMVARVPLFADLTAGEIADVMRLLKAQTVEAGATVVRRGDQARSMYFIAAGEVEIELEGEAVRLGVGHFFGEVAVLRRARRSATVTAVSRTSLLVLDGADLHALMERDKRLAERVRAVARDRLGHDVVVSPRGDIVAAELKDSGHEE